MQIEKILVKEETLSADEERLKQWMDSNSDTDYLKFPQHMDCSMDDAPDHWKIFASEAPEPDQDRYVFIFMRNWEMSYTCLMARLTWEDGQPFTFLYFFYCISYLGFVKDFCRLIGLQEEHLDQETTVIKEIREWGFPANGPPPYGLFIPPAA